MAKNVSVALSTNVAAFRQQMAAAATAVQSFGGAAKMAGAALADTESRTQSLTTHMNGLRNAMAGVGVATGLAFGTKLAANLEQTQVAFTGILGSGQEAAAFIQRLQQFAAVTPFTFTGLTAATQQLLALGQTGDEALGTLTTIGNAVAAMGGGEEQIQGVVRALTQMQSKGRLAAQDMNQISEQLPTLQRAAVFDVLAEKMGKTREEVAKLAETGQITADQGLAAIYEVMQNLPGATGAMGRQAQTLTGVLSSLKDQLTIAVSAGFGPLAGAIRDSVYPLLQQLGVLLKDTMTPLGAALGDVFHGLAQAFDTLAPLLPGIADAFASILSAVAPLIPLAAQLLEVGLRPTVMVVQALAGALEWLLNDLPGVTTAVGLLAGAFVGLKVGEALTHGLLMLSGALAVIQDAFAGAATGAEVFQASLGPIGIALAVAGAALGGFALSQAGAKKQVDDFKIALDQEADAAQRAVDAIIAKKIVDDDLDKAAQRLGLSTDTVARAMQGNADAIKAVHTAAQGYIQGNRGKAMDENMRQTTIGAQNLMKAVDGTSSSLAAARDEQERTNAILGKTPAVNNAAAKSYEELDKAISKAFNPLQAYQDAVKQATNTDSDSSKTAVDAIHKRFDAQKDALSLAERDEKEALDRRVQAQKDALDAEHKSLLDALELRHRAEQDAFDDEARAQKDALDRQHRTEKEALDKRLRLIDEAADKRKTAEDRRFDAEKDEIQFNIDSTFGAERESWKDRLTQAEDAHDDRLSDIKDQADDEKQALKDQLDDQQLAEKNSLDDRLRTLKENLGDRETAEKTAEDTRYQNAQAALATQTTQWQDTLDDKYRRLKQNLDDQETLATTAEETRRTNAKRDQDLSLTQYQTFLDKQTEKAEQFNRDLATIATRGGADVMDEIAKLDPAIVAQAAAAGPAAFTAFLEGIRANLAAGKHFSDQGLPGGVTFGTTRSRAVAGHAEGHFAMIAATGPRLWAEPETGGEAYIPLALSKRARSLDIWRRTGEVLGADVHPMANGGIIGMSSGGGGRAGGINVSVMVENHLAPGIDMGVAGRLIGDEVHRAVRGAVADVARKVTVKSRLP